MSTEVKEKMNMDPKYLMKLTVTLLITCAIVAGLLGLVNGVTVGPITEATEKKTAEALSKVFQDAEAPTFPALEMTEAEMAAAAAYSATLKALYEVQDGGETVGYAVQITAAGSQGTIEMVVGVDMDQAVTGVSIVKNAETSGIGSKIMNNNALPSGMGVLDQFAGMSHAAGDLKVPNNVDAITGATVSTKGVTKGVNGALATVAAIG